MKLWRDLAVTPEEEAMAREIRDSGAGKSLTKEELNAYTVGEEQDLEIDTRAGKCLVHLYWPEDRHRDKLLPLLVNIHGGGFIKGRRDQDIVFCRNLCSRSGCICLDIDYVPAPAMRYPGQVYACYDVVQYCGEHAEELGADQARIAISGHSAGGNLAAAVLLMAIDNQAFVPALQILDYAGFDMKTPAIQKRNGDSNPRIPAWKADFYNKMYVDPDQAEEVYCSPCFATGEQLSHMPPTVMIYCENDTFCDENAEFHRRLLAQGVPVYGKRFMHSNHGFTVQRKGEYQEAERMILAALRVAFF
ncbi:MAG: alpha/beta hydrolase [Lachnospiraceae bacterium]|nr:alpha/beta hydrolase [Lachnospiraceae bacterium]